MSTHDMNIANQSFPNFRTDLNNALAALVSNSSSTTEPATTFAHQYWVDTSSTPSVLKIRNAANDAWVTIGSIDESNNTFSINIDNATFAGDVTIGDASGDTLTINSGTVTASNAAMTVSSLTSTNQATIDGLTVGQGAGNVATNTAVGVSALAANTTGSNNAAVGYAAMDANTTGSSNTAIGRDSLGSNTTGLYNTAVGRNAAATNTSGEQITAVGYNALIVNTANHNTAVGSASLQANTTGATNTAVGSAALYSNTTASNNTAVGYAAAYANTTGVNNTAVGYAALDANTTGTRNSAFGNNALGSNTTGQYNSAFGEIALSTNSTGSYNTALGRAALNLNTASNNTGVGYDALTNNTSGDSNTALGVSALNSNTTASSNTAVGYQAGYSNTTGTYLTAIGTSALFSNTTGIGNIGVGLNAGYYITTGSKNVILGSYTGNAGGLDIRTASNNIVLSDGDGNPRQVIDPQGCVVIPGYGAPLTGRASSASLSVYKNFDNKRVAHFQNNRNVSSDECLRVVLGSNCSNTSSYFQINTIEGVGDKLYMYGNGTVQNATGSYGAFSDAKLKENIVDATPKLDKVLQLQVRNFNMIGDDLKQIGFVAQEIEQVFPGLVDNTPDRDEDGNDLGTVTKGVKTSVLIPILVKAIQELSAKVDAQAAELATLKGN